MRHGGRKGVAGSDGVRDFHAKARMLVLRSGSNEQAAVGSTRDTHQLDAEFAAEPAGGGQVPAFRVLQRTLNQVKETGKFLVIEFQDFRVPRGIAKYRPAEKRLAEVDVEDRDGKRRHGAEERLDGGAGGRISLSQRTEADRVSGTRQRNPVFGKLHEV